MSAKSDTTLSATMKYIRKELASKPSSLKREPIFSRMLANFLEKECKSRDMNMKKWSVTGSNKYNALINRHICNMFPRDSIEKSFEEIENVIDFDPDFVLSLCGISPENKGDPTSQKFFYETISREFVALHGVTLTAENEQLLLLHKVFIDVSKISKVKSVSNETSGDGPCPRKRRSRKRALCGSDSDTSNGECPYLKNEILSSPFDQCQ